MSRRPAPTAAAAGMTYDTGMLLAAARGSRMAWALHDELLAAGRLPTVPTVVVAQAWRPGRDQAGVARLLRGCAQETLDPATARAVGTLAGSVQHPDVVDLTIAEGALRRGDDVVTSDPTDLVRCGVDARRIVRI